MELTMLSTRLHWATVVSLIFVVLGSVTLLAQTSLLWTVLCFAIAWYAGYKGSQREAQTLNLWLHFLSGAGFWTSLLFCLNV